MKINRLQTIENMLEEAPDDVFLLYALALEYKAIGDFEKSIFYLDKVLAINLEYVAAYYQKGELLAVLGRSKEALDVLGRGRKIALTKLDQKTAGEFSQLILAIED